MEHTGGDQGRRARNARLNYEDFFAEMDLRLAQLKSHAPPHLLVDDRQSLEGQSEPSPAVGATPTISYNSTTTTAVNTPFATGDVVLSELESDNAQHQTDVPGVSGASTQTRTSSVGDTTLREHKPWNAKEVGKALQYFKSIADSLPPSFRTHYGLTTPVPEQPTLPQHVNEQPNVSASTVPPFNVHSQTASKILGLSGASATLPAAYGDRIGSIAPPSQFPNNHPFPLGFVGGPPSAIVNQPAPFSNEVQPSSDGSVPAETVPWPTGSDGQFNAPLNMHAPPLQLNASQQGANNPPPFPPLSFSCAYAPGYMPGPAPHRGHTMVAPNGVVYHIPSQGPQFANASFIAQPASNVALQEEFVQGSSSPHGHPGWVPLQGIPSPNAALSIQSTIGPQRAVKSKRGAARSNVGNEALPEDKCPVCAKVLLGEKKSDIRKHLMIHRPRQYRCPRVDCEKRFVRGDSLKRHLIERQETPERANPDAINCLINALLVSNFHSVEEINDALQTGPWENRLERLVGLWDARDNDMERFKVDEGFARVLDAWEAVLASSLKK